jgi:hypothetical protein
VFIETQKEKEKIRKKRSKVDRYFENYKKIYILFMIYAFYCIAERDQVKYMLITIGCRKFSPELHNFTN